MISFSEWVHRHSFLLLVVAVVGCTAVPFLFRRWPLWVWLGWAGLALAGAGSIFLLHTPAATVSEHQPDESASLHKVDTQKYRELSPESEEKIEELLAAGPKLTLVEIYVDYGLG